MLPQRHVCFLPVTIGPITSAIAGFGSQPRVDVPRNRVYFL
jgi:hypothetical protein